MSRRLLPLVVLLALGAPAVGCQNYQDQLARAEQHYESAHYQAALANLEDLELHVPWFSTNERVRYDVARGMTHLRLEQRDAARYWLALAREEARAVPDTLSEATRAQIEHVIAETDPLGPAPSTDGAGSSGGESGAHGTAAPASATQ